MVEKIIKAAVCLHNYLRQTDTANYTPAGFVDSENGDGTIIPRNWLSPERRILINQFKPSQK